MIQPQRTEISLSRFKILKLVAFAFVFVAAGYFMVTMDSSVIMQQKRFNNPLFVHGIGLAGLLMGIVGTVAGGLRLFSSAPGLVIDERGITDTSGPTAFGHIPWGEITGLAEGAVRSQRFIYVLLRDPERFIAGFSPARRALLRGNARMGPSPAALSNATLDIEFHDLRTLLATGLAEARAAAGNPAQAQA